MMNLDQALSTDGEGEAQDFICVGGKPEEEAQEYTMEDLLRRAAESLKKHRKQGGELQLESGLENTKLYLHTSSAEDGKLPSAVLFKGNPKQLGPQVKKTKNKGPGRSWTFMKTPRMTKARKQEYRVILLRDQLDPKRRYKRMPNKIPKVFQIGRVIAGAGDFYSGRLSMRERKGTLVDELLADRQLRQRSKRKYSEIAKERSSGRAEFLKKRKADRLPKWKKNVFA